MDHTTAARQKKTHLFLVRYLSKMKGEVCVFEQDFRQFKSFVKYRYKC